MTRGRSSAGLLVALVCGLGFALSFPRAGLAPLAWVAPVPWLALVLASRGPRAGLLGFVYGAGFFGLLLNWVHGVLSQYTSLPFFLTIPIWGLLVGYLALYPALFSVLVSALGRRFGRGTALAAAPALWVGLEFVRARFLGGFPWGTAGYARAGGLALLQSASVGGIALVSLLLAAGWSALTQLLFTAAAWFRRRR